MYESMTRFLPQLEQADEYGRVIVDRDHKGTLDDPFSWPYVAYGSTVIGLEEAVYAFVDDHPEFELNHYYDILERNGLKWDMDTMLRADVSMLDGQAVMALLLGAIRAERFCDGALLDFCEAGAVARWLRRLEELDGAEGDGGKAR